MYQTTIYLMMTIALLNYGFGNVSFAGFSEDRVDYWPSPSRQRVYRVARYSERDQKGRLTHFMPLISAIKTDGSIDNSFGEQGGILLNFVGWEFVYINQIIEYKSNLYIIGHTQEDSRAEINSLIDESGMHQFAQAIYNLELRHTKGTTNAFIVKLDLKGQLEHFYGDRGVCELPLRGLGAAAPTIEQVYIDRKGGFILPIYLGFDIYQDSPERTKYMLARVNRTGVVDESFAEDGFFKTERAIYGVAFTGHNIIQVFFSEIDDLDREHYFHQIIGADGKHVSPVRNLKGLESYEISSIHNNPFDDESLIAVLISKENRQLAKISFSNLNHLEPLLTTDQPQFSNLSKIIPVYGKQPAIWVTDISADQDKVSVFKISKDLKVEQHMQILHKADLCNNLFRQSFNK